MTNAESMGAFQTERYTPRHTPRRASRVLPDSPLVICFPSGNRGIVIDISPAGVGFLAGAPIEEDEPICFTISGKSAPMTEAAGELMWKDSTGKRAGVRFTHVSEGLRALIDHLLSNHKLSGHELIGHTPLKHTRTTHTLVNQTSISDKLIGQPQIRHGQRRENKPSEALEADATSAAELAVAANKVTAPLPSTPSTRKRFGVAANAMTAAVALFMAVGIWFPLDRHGLIGSVKALEHGASQMMSRMRTYHVKFADAHVAGAREEGSVAFESHANSAGPVLRRAAKTYGATPARAKRAKGQTARRPSRQTDGGGSEDVAESPESLWQAVEKGSSTAEIKLADLYLQANGVEKSCSQAEVLLTAAQRHKSALAAQKLAGLAGYGCE